MLQLRLLRVLVVTLLVLTVTVASLPCSPRHFGKDSFVCVCDSTHCDDFAAIPAKQNGSALIYVSDRFKRRFEESTLKFHSGITQQQTNASTNHFKIIGSDARANRQIIGFGGSFTDAAAINILQLGSELSKRIIQNYYAENGLRYTMGRVPIGGSDFSARGYTYDDADTDDFNLTKFALQKEDLEFKIPLIQLAQNITPELKLFGSPWSAPEWMKTNHNLTGKGQLKGATDGPYYKTWAEYFVKFLQEYSHHNVNFWGLTMQNEPFDGTLENFPFNCMAMSPIQQRDFLTKNLWPALKKNGFEKLKLMIGDDQRPFVRRYADAILTDPAMSKLVAGVAFHWYMNAYTSPDILTNLTIDYPDQFLISSEACEGSNPLSDTEKVVLGSWRRAENYAYDILQDLTHSTSAWVDWNLALDLEGGPNWSNNFVDAPIIVNATAGEYYKQPMFYILGHFSRFISPGSQRLVTISKSSDADAIDGAFFSIPNGDTVAVLLNRFESTIPVSIETGDSHRGTLDLEMGPKSIATIVW